MEKPEIIKESKPEVAIESVNHEIIESESIIMEKSQEILQSIGELTDPVSSNDKVGLEDAQKDVFCH